MQWISKPADPGIPGQGPYERWIDTELGAHTGPGTRYYPVYGGLKATGGSVAATIDAILAAQDAANPAIAIDGSEAVWLAHIKSTIDDPGTDPELRATVAYIREGQLNAPGVTGKIDAWHIAPPVVLNPATARALAPGALAPAPSGSGAPRQTPPVIGVIDDAIPFLNRRTTDGPGKTRFLGAWLQSRERPVELTAAVDDHVVRVGRSFTPADIDALLSRDIDESAAYRAINDTLYHPPEIRILDHAFAHGAAVLDRAAGGAPGADAAMDATKILGVQLPPHALADTSGRRFAVHVIRSLRWIVFEAKREFDRRNARPGRAVMPLIVNLSLGTQAGPKDGTETLDRALAREVARYRALTGSEMRIVLAYGNAQRTQQTALVDLGAAASETLDWRVLPDDHSASFLELRGTDTARIEITPPGGPTLSARLSPSDDEHFLMDGSEVIAALYQGLGGPNDRLLAIRPTASRRVARHAPAGGWTVTLKRSGAARPEIAVEVQRDDTPPPHHLLGRQSYLDHPHAYTRDPETADYALPAPDCPIKREGTHAAHGAASAGPAPNADRLPIYTVGAATERRRKASDPFDPSLYTPAGTANAALSSSRGPDLSAIADVSRGMGGRLTMGVRSSATMRLSGTSAAAPAVTRALAGQADALKPLTSQALKNAEISGLGGKVVSAGKERLGKRTLAG